MTIPTEPYPSPGYIAPSAQDAADNYEVEDKNKHILSEDLRTFEGTSAEAFIIEGLAKKGIDAKTFNAHDANNYRGLPSTGSDSYRSEDFVASPIVELFYDGLNEGTIVQEVLDVSNTAVTSSAEMKDKLSKLHLFDTTILRDLETSDVLGYAVHLTGDGGRQDYAIVGPNALNIIFNASPAVADLSRVLHLKDR